MKTIPALALSVLVGSTAMRRHTFVLALLAALAGCASWTGPVDDAPIVLGPRDRAWLSPRDIERAECLVGELTCDMGGPLGDQFCRCARR